MNKKYIEKMENSIKECKEEVSKAVDLVNVMLETYKLYR